MAEGTPTHQQMKKHESTNKCRHDCCAAVWVVVVCSKELTTTTMNPHTCPLTAHVKARFSDNSHAPCTTASQGPTDASFVLIKQPRQAMVRPRANMRPLRQLCVMVCTHRSNVNAVAPLLGQAVTPSTKGQPTAVPQCKHTRSIIKQRHVWLVGPRCHHAQ